MIITFINRKTGEVKTKKSDGTLKEWITAITEKCSIDSVDTKGKTTYIQTGKGTFTLEEGK